jgi:hypothetical protein
MISIAELRLLSQLLDEVLDQPEGERLAWLEKRPDLSPALRSLCHDLLAGGPERFELPALPVYGADRLPGKDRGDG